MDREHSGLAAVEAAAITVTALFRDHHGTPLLARRRVSATLIVW